MLRHLVSVLKHNLRSAPTLWYSQHYVDSVRNTITLTASLVWLNQETGRKYIRTDQLRHPEPPQIRTVTHKIPVKGDWGSNSGELGIVQVAVYRDTEIAALMPRRGGVYDRKNITIQPRPCYHDPDCDPKWYFDPVQQLVYKVECMACGDYQKREAFGPRPAKRNGLQSNCYTCEAARMRRFREAA